MLETDESGFTERYRCPCALSEIPDNQWQCLIKRLAECKDTVDGKSAMRAETVLLVLRTAKINLVVTEVITDWSYRDHQNHRRQSCEHL